MKSIAGSAGVVGFWMVAPESLRLVGQASGYGGPVSVLAMLLFLIVTLMGTMSRQKSCQQSTPLVLQMMSLFGVLATTVMAATGMLVSAGFTFNEVFYHRFANFGFAFLLLFTVLVVQLLKERVRFLFQVVSVGLVIVVIMTLSLSGLSQLPITSASNSIVSSPTLLGLVPLIYIYLGLDESPAITDQTTGNVALIAAIVGGALLLSCWMVVSYSFVGAERLIASSLPFMNTATAVWGHPGRLLMGGAVISGVAGAVCGLFTLCRHKIELMCPQHARQSTFLLPIMLTVIIATMLTAGVAGSQHIETYIEMSLLFWLLSSAVVLIYKAVKNTRWVWRLVGLTSGLAYLVSSFILFYRLDENLSGFMLLAILGGCTVIATLLARRPRVS